MRTWIRHIPWLTAATLVLGVGMLCSVPAPTVAAQPPEEWDGLHRMPDKNGDHVYLLRNADFSGYTHVMVAPVLVSFDENWEPNRGTRGARSVVSESDMERLRSGLAREFHSEFENQLTRAGWMIAQDSGEHVLQVTPEIVNLYVTAPNTQANRGRTYVANTGRMTLALEMRDSVSGQLLGRVIDTQQGRRGGGFTLASPVTNLADAQRAINSWGRMTVQAIDYAKASSQTALAERKGDTTPR